ncbi:MarR family transcriptional regulator [Saccharopolyspora indica]|uniref:GbsR/MarR family transcriptional regulator n=1 Tax=Saccharopolyspora indica TaxID=1229659 RepID=UPI0022EB6FC7|nr:MarR family transcriptional regulator [Saccharopolyspora indica]MDA3647932.1 MarR family transcriptional regulator [Saccharopolyspora indica]
MSQFVENAAMTFAEWGFSRMAARVLMTLMTADEDALTAADLSERLGVGPPAISGAVRYLMQLGIVERRPVPGSRRDSYRLRDDAWYTSSVTKGGIYQAIAELAEDGVRALGDTGSPAVERITDMRDFFRFIHAEMAGLLDKWQQVENAERTTPPEHS